MSDKPHVKVAVLDDYQGVALSLADWSALGGRAEVTVFRDHLAEPDAIVARLQPFDVVCVMRDRTPLPRTVLEQLERLRLIVSTGASNASVDQAAAEERAVAVCHTGGGSHGAAEMTWALILAAVRHVPVEVESVRRGGWQVAVGGDLNGRTLGVVGLGRVGSAVALVGQAFGMDVVAWSQNLTTEAASAAGVRLVDREELFRVADIVTLHLVLSDRTRGVVGAAEIARMKPTAWLINAARGLLVDEAALIDALRARRIAGAALDVYDIEPLPANHPFRTLDNVLATGHVGFVTRDAYEAFYSQTVGCIATWLDGHPV